MTESTTQTPFNDRSNDHPHDHPNDRSVDRRAGDTDTGATPSPGISSPGMGRAGRLITRTLAIIAFIAFVTFWTWALFFASKDAVNKIGDDAWKARSEQYCADAASERETLADYTLIRGSGPEVMRQRADLVDRATDTLDVMLDQIAAHPPADEKGQNVVPLWLDEYHTYVNDRRAYATELRTTGKNVAFYETKVYAIPISERLSTFAADNEILSCVPPRDVSS